VEGAGAKADADAIRRVAITSFMVIDWKYICVDWMPQAQTTVEAWWKKQEKAGETNLA
jgi:hypothetical protein